MNEEVKGYIARIEQIVGKPLCFMRYYPNTGIYVEVGLHNYKPDIKETSYNIPWYVIRDERASINITYFKLMQLPGCCAFCLSTGVSVAANYRNKGINNICNELRQYLAKAAGYSAIICTDKDKNIAERKTLAKNGWQDIFQVKNRRTNNLVNISVKLL